MTDTNTPEPTTEPTPKEGVRVDKKEFILLDAYCRSESEGAYSTMPQMTNKLAMTRAEFDGLLTKIRERGWVGGARKIVVTEEGHEAYDKIVKFLKSSAVPVVDSMPVTPQVNHEAAATATQVPAPGPQRDEVNTYNSRQANAVVATRMPDNAKLSDVLASRLRVSAEDVFDVIKNNIISVGSGPAPTNAEVMQVMSVMQKYDLDPFVKQVHAFRHRGKLQIAVGNDGWTAIAQRHPGFKGVEYEFPDEMVKTEGGKMCWPWVKGICHIEGRVPTVKYAFLEEWYVPTGPNDKGPSNWSLYPTHRLQGKVYSLVVKEALGISLYDLGDMEQFHQTEAVVVPVSSGALTDRIDDMRLALTAPDPAGDVEVVE